MVALWWWRWHPTPRPFTQRLWIDVPHPFITQERLHEALQRELGERLLDVGVGGGRYALQVAGGLGGTGRLDVLDLQEEMLALTMRRALKGKISNIVPVRGDAPALPYANETFDAAYVVSTLGQLPDMAAALREVHRVLRPKGRVVVGEVCYDPHGVFFGTLSRHVSDAGFQLDRRIGDMMGFFAVFHRVGVAVQPTQDRCLTVAKCPEAVAALGLRSNPRGTSAA